MRKFKGRKKGVRTSEGNGGNNDTNVTGVRAIV